MLITIVIAATTVMEAIIILYKIALPSKDCNQGKQEKKNQHKQDDKDDYDKFGKEKLLIIIRKVYHKIKVVNICNRKM